MSENLTDIVAQARRLFEIGDFPGVKRTLEAASFDESSTGPDSDAAAHARAEARTMVSALRPDPVAIGAFALTTFVLVILLVLYAS